MKAVLLCAGAGTRLRPLTFARPKHLLPVAGRAVLDWVLCDLAEAGVDEVVLVVGCESRHLREFVGDGARWGMTVTYAVQEKPLGLAHALSCARQHLEDERFLMYLGDDLLDRGVVAKFAASFAQSDAHASLLVKPVEDPRAFGVVVMEDGCVTRLIEKPSRPPSDLAIVGVYAFGPEIWEGVDNIEPSARGELEITDAIDYLVRAGRTVHCHVTDGFWADAGSPAALLSANRYFLGFTERRIEGDVDGASSVEGSVQIAGGARVLRSQIVGPCIIGPDCVIKDCVIGAGTSVGAGCTLTATVVADSIIDDHCRVERVRPGLHRSIVGPAAVIADMSAEAPLRVLAADGTVLMPDEERG